MIRTGLTGFFVSKYLYVNGERKYVEGKLFISNTGVSFQDDPQTADNTSSFYVNNAAKYHSGGGKLKNIKLTVGMDGMPQEAVAFILGVPAGTVEGVESLIYGDNINPPYVGWGFVETRESDSGESEFLPKIYTKVKFTPTGKTLNTEGESRDFQSETLNGSAIADDTEDHAILIEPKKPFTGDGGLKQAVEFIKKVLNIAEPEG